ncbi:MAG: ribosome biogenesis GTP-binding protein YihA/YsxC [Bacteroidales bacterium]|jgi:GTP-binding protein|nr:ribosome biogenesis GTP-binding protein YihA/YsxC [Bacteroidales bacterium]
MKINNAIFVKSSPKWNLCPAPVLPEYAFIGRSNVGKSSFINMLTNNNKLAKISSTPGKTQLINHYLINKAWYLVDLPGYGYAKAAKTVRSQFSTMISDYIQNRSNLVYLCILIDSRLQPQQIDLDILYQIGEAAIPFLLIFTKIDKQSMTTTKENINVFLQKVAEYWEVLPPYFISSAVTKAGKEDFLLFLEKTNKCLIEN